MSAQSVAAWIAQVLAAGGGGALIAVLICRWFGEKWLEQRFQKRLELFKHERQKELEQLRHQISSLYSRISKIHEKEFEVLPKAWELLHRAQGATFELVKALRQEPDVARMSDPQLSEFLRREVLAEFKKDEIRNATTGKERESLYREAVFWRELSEAQNAQKQLNNYLALNSIFLPSELKTDFANVNRALISVNVGKEVSHGQPYDATTQKNIDDNFTKMSKLFEEIESAVQKRLRYEEA